MSVRFGLPVALVLLLALLPTAIHSYVGLRIEDGLLTSAIPETLAGFYSTKTTRNATWGERRFSSQDWIERTYHSSGTDVRLAVVRSFDLKKLYHHPELAVAYGVDLRPTGIQRLDSDAGPVLLHTFESAASPRQVVMYGLMYDRQFIEDPVWFQLRTAGTLLVGGRRQMTMFFVHQPDVRGTVAWDQTAAATVVRAAIEAFAQQAPVSAAN